MSIVDVNSDLEECKRVRVVLWRSPNTSNRAFSSYCKCIQQYSNIPYSNLTLSSTDPYLACFNDKNFRQWKENSVFSLRFMTSDGASKSEWSDMRYNMHTLGVIGIHDARAQPDAGIRDAYELFKSSLGQHPQALAYKFFVFTPEAESSSLTLQDVDHLVHFPTTNLIQIHAHLESVMSDFATAILRQLGANVQRPVERCRPLSTPLDAPNMEPESSSKRKRNSFGRLRKMQGDLHLLASDAVHALPLFILAYDSAKSSGDYVWQAAALEGQAAAIYQYLTINAHELDKVATALLAQSNAGVMIPSTIDSILVTEGSLPAPIETLLREYPKRQQGGAYGISGLLGNTTGMNATSDTYPQYLTVAEARRAEELSRNPVYILLDIIVSKLREVMVLYSKIPCESVMYAETCISLARLHCRIGAKNGALETLNKLQLDSPNIDVTNQLALLIASAGVCHSAGAYRRFAFCLLRAAIKLGEERCWAVAHSAFAIIIPWYHLAFLDLPPETTSMVLAGNTTKSLTNLWGSAVERHKLPQSSTNISCTHAEYGRRGASTKEQLVGEMIRLRKSLSANGATLPRDWKRPVKNVSNTTLLLLWPVMDYRLQHSTLQLTAKRAGSKTASARLPLGCTVLVPTPQNKPSTKRAVSPSVGTRTVTPPVKCAFLGGLCRGVCPYLPVLVKLEPFDSSKYDSQKHWPNISGELCSGVVTRVHQPLLDFAQLAQRSGAKRQSKLFLFSPWRQLHTASRDDGHSSPRATNAEHGASSNVAPCSVRWVVNELRSVRVSVRNPLSIELVLDKARLVVLGAEAEVHPVTVLVPPSTTVEVTFELNIIPKECGFLYITGLTYNLARTDTTQVLLNDTPALRKFLLNESTPQKDKEAPSNKREADTKTNSAAAEDEAVPDIDTSAYKTIISSVVAVVEVVPPVPQLQAAAEVLHVDGRSSLEVMSPLVGRRRSKVGRVADSLAVDDFALAGMVEEVLGHQTGSLNMATRFGFRSALLSNLAGECGTRMVRGEYKAVDMDIGWLRPNKAKLTFWESEVFFLAANLSNISNDHIRYLSVSIEPTTGTDKTAQQTYSQFDKPVDPVTSKHYQFLKLFKYDIQYAKQPYEYLRASKEFSATAITGSRRFSHHHGPKNVNDGRLARPDSHDNDKPRHRRRSFTAAMGDGETDSPSPDGSTDKSPIIPAKCFLRLPIRCIATVKSQEFQVRIRCSESEDHDYLREVILPVSLQVENAMRFRPNGCEFYPVVMFDWRAVLRCLITQEVFSSYLTTVLSTAHSPSTSSTTTQHSGYHLLSKKTLLLPSMSPQHTTGTDPIQVEHVDCDNAKSLMCIELTNSAPVAFDCYSAVEPEKRFTVAPHDNNARWALLVERFNLPVPATTFNVLGAIDRSLVLRWTSFPSRFGTLPLQFMQLNPPADTDFGTGNTTTRGKMRSTPGEYRISQDSQNTNLFLILDKPKVSIQCRVTGPAVQSVHSCGQEMGQAFDGVVDQTRAANMTAPASGASAKTGMYGTAYRRTESLHHSDDGLGGDALQGPNSVGTYELSLGEHFTIEIFVSNTGTELLHGCTVFAVPFVYSTDLEQVHLPEGLVWTGNLQHQVDEIAPAGDMMESPRTPRSTMTPRSLSPSGTLITNSSLEPRDALTSPRRSAPPYGYDTPPTTSHTSEQEIGTFCHSVSFMTLSGGTYMVAIGLLCESTRTLWWHHKPISLSC